MHLQIPKRRVIVVGLAASLWASQPSGARADEAEAIGDSAVSERVISAALSPARFLPGVVMADAGAARVSGLAWGGYDGATGTALMGATAEARLSARVVIGAGAVYAPAAYDQAAAVRPSVVLRVQILEQRSRGFDAGVAVAYREDRFVGEEGFIQGTVATAYQGERNSWLGNLSYGQDGEGDDFEGELRLAALRRFGERVNLGVDGRFRKSLWSTDARGNPTMEYRVAPTLAYALGPVALTAAAGVGGVRVAGRTESGFVALGGVGAIF
jgi:hypothetical protein